MCACTCWSVSALMTVPRHESDWLIAMASLSESPVAPDLGRTHSAQRPQWCARRTEWAPGAVGTEQHQRLCVICMDEGKSHLFTACGHKCVCAMCAARIRAVAAAAETGATCPVCRVVSTTIVRVYD